MADRAHEQILEWATAAKRAGRAAGLDPLPSDEHFIRAAIAVNMCTSNPHPEMTIVDDEVLGEAFNRASAIVKVAIGFADTPPSTPDRAALFAEVLRG